MTTTTSMTVTSTAAASTATSTSLELAGRTSVDARSAADETVKVLLYSDDRNTRSAIRLALGRRPAPDLPKIEYVETATEPGTVARLEVGDIALAILDGEAVPAGGMGVCRQIKDEIYRCPPVVVIVGRPQDAWLATWSRADAVVSHPIDPVAMAHAVARLLRAQARGAITAH
jgi:DNA-binding response OmpR family regulator